ncbi:LOB domain-containing protein 36 isoform X2 [Ricinus communis]|uniref:Protein ASYMMETRIC LEAVES2, putative n=1 Tax=Ricinus communis TaxID=3988 RepID=B9S8K6_RICCO|nr:LOB domain-containing protein 36 isoform X2 [Ricinus communis]EEF40009.1 Protein ASYMMETRIC LEAVES2, putative [Ricinus communis]|eukprot:XP_025013725.1 LOB domain-containing protein 36 [Ricinus communis]
MSTPISPCAACKLQRRKCTQDCVFAPYFPPDQPQKFANLHKVFGASNVAKLLNELNTAQREDAVNSLAYEAEARLRDPVYGCVGLISILQHRLKELQSDLYNAKKELAQYIGPQAMLTTLPAPTFMGQPHLGNPSSSLIQHNALPIMGGIPAGTVHGHGGPLMIREPQQQQQQHQIFEAQQLAAALAAREQQEMLRAYEQQQQQQQEIVRFNRGYDVQDPVHNNTAGFNQITVAAMSPSLALGSFDTPYQIQSQPLDHQQQHQLQAQLFLQPTKVETPPQQQHQFQQTQQQQQQQQRSGSDEGGSIGPSC